MAGYVAAKEKIFQSRFTHKYVGVDDAEGRAMLERLRASRQAVDEVSVAGPLEGVTGMYLHQGWLTYNVRPSRGAPMERCKIVDLARARSLPGRHNAQNAAFAFLVATDMGIPHETVIEGLMTFPGLAHRMEEVGTLGPVRFINDSKATNTDAARQALLSYPSVFWIAGGRAKAGGIDDLADLFPRVARAYLIGEAASDFARTLSGVSHQISGDMASAVAQAAADAAEVAETDGPQVVLLSPAAASFDQYPDFEARGEAFRAAVLALGATPAATA